MQPTQAPALAWQSHGVFVAGMDAICVPLRDPYDRTQAVIRQWAELTRSAPPILAAEFFCATLRWLVHGNAHLVGVWRGGDLVAALPLLSWEGELRALVSSHTPRFDVTGDAGAVPALWRAIAEVPDWHRLTLDEVPAASPLATTLVRLARADGYVAVVQPTGRSPYMELADFESRLRGRFRRNLRSRARKLAGMELERPACIDDAALDEAFDLEAAAWKGQAGTAIKCNERLRGFYAEIGRHFAARGQLGLVFLRAHNRRIAVHFAIEDAHTYYLLKPGYDPQYAAFAPGHQLVHQAALDARGRHVKELDFLGREMKWKGEWTERTRQHLAIQIYRPSFTGRLRFAAEHKIRPALGRLLRRAGLRRAWQPPANRHDLMTDTGRSETL